MKLNEKYEDYLLKKASREGGRDFRRYTNTIFNAIAKEPDITKRKIQKITKQTPLNYSSYLNFIDTSLAVAPIVNYITQPEDIRKNEVTRGLKAQIQRLIKNSNIDIKNHRQTVDRAYSIMAGVKQGEKSQVHQDFTSFLNTIAPERERIMSEARDRLRENTKLFKNSLTNEMFKDYKDYLDLGFSKQDAIDKMLADNRIKNDHKIKRYLETEAHEDYEKAKISNAEANGFKYKYWRSQRDGRVRHTHMILDGQIKKNDEPFKVGKSLGMYPGDSSLPLDERINCRCSTEFAFVPRGTRQGYELPRKVKPPEIAEDVLEDLEKEEKKVDYLKDDSVDNKTLLERQKNYADKLLKSKKRKKDKLWIKDDENYQGAFLQLDKILPDFLNLAGKESRHEIEIDGVTHILEIGFNSKDELGNKHDLVARLSVEGLKYGNSFERLNIENIYREGDKFYYSSAELGDFLVAETDMRMEDYILEEKATYKGITPQFYNSITGEVTINPLAQHKTELSKYKFQGDDVDEEDIDTLPTLLNYRKRENELLWARIRLEDNGEIYNLENPVEKRMADYTKVVVEATLDKNEFAMRVPNNEVLVDILSDGRFKNIQETGKGYGLSDVDLRNSVSKRMFGTPDANMYGEKIQDSDFERYGYLADRDIERELNAGDKLTVNQYGNVLVTFRKENLAQRTTFTMGDSFQFATRPNFSGKSVSQRELPDDVPQPVTNVNPQFISIDGFSMTRSYAYETLEDVIEKQAEQKARETGQRVNAELEALNGIEDLTNFHSNMFTFKNTAPSYIELQYHGELTLRDIKDITMPLDLLQTEPGQVPTMFDYASRGKGYTVAQLKRIKTAQEQNGFELFGTYVEKTGEKDRFGINVYKTKRVKLDVNELLNEIDKLN